MYGIILYVFLCTQFIFSPSFLFLSVGGGEKVNTGIDGKGGSEKVRGINKCEGQFLSQNSPSSCLTRMYVSVCTCM